MQACVTRNIECAHRDPGGQIHGHSYVIQFWFMAGPDLPDAEGQVRAITDAVDHTLLEDSIGAPGMEAVAERLFARAAAGTGLEMTRVIVARPTLGYLVEYRP